MPLRDQFHDPVLFRLTLKVSNACLSRLPKTKLSAANRLTPRHTDHHPMTETV